MESAIVRISWRNEIVGMSSSILGNVGGVSSIIRLTFSSLLRVSAVKNAEDINVRAGARELLRAIHPGELFPGMRDFLGGWNFLY